MKINPSVVFRKEFDNTGLLFNPENGKTCGLNPVAVVIWNGLENGDSRETIIAAIRSKNSNCPPEIADDVESFIESLKNAGFCICVQR